MNGHDFTREQNMEARMTLAVARRPTRRPHVGAVHRRRRHDPPNPVEPRRNRLSGGHSPNNRE